MNDILRYGLVAALIFIVSVLALRLISRGGHEVANTAGALERKV
jgi:hypothetical protein